MADATSAIGAMYQAMEVDGVNLMSATAGVAMRAELDNMYTTEYILSKAEVQEIHMLCGYYVRPLNKKPRPSCHWQLAVLRDMIRGTYVRFARPETTRAKTLVIAAAHREISKYWKNKNVDFYVYGKEGKDSHRVVMKMLEELRDETAKRAILTEDQENVQIPKTKKRAVLTIKDLEEMLCAYQLAKDGVVDEKRIYTTIPKDKKYDQLLIEDGHYNFSKRDWLRMFADTGATSATIIGLLPYELLFPHAPESVVYKIRERDKPGDFDMYNLIKTVVSAMQLAFIGRDGFKWLATVLVTRIITSLKGINRREYDDFVADFVAHLSKYASFASALGLDDWHERVLVGAQITWDMARKHLSKTEMVMTYNGHSNGYIHDRDAMMCLLDNPCISAIDYAFSLHSEIYQRLGPMVVVKLNRSDLRERVCRTLSVGRTERYVRVLDVIGSYDFLNKSPREARYITMYHREFFDVVDFLSAQKPETITVQMAMTMVRRASAGLSLGKTVLSPAWRLDNELLYRVATTTALVAIERRGLSEMVTDDAFSKMITGEETRWKHYMGVVLSTGLLIATAGLAIPLMGMYGWLMKKHIRHPLYLSGTDEVYQEGGNPGWASYAERYGKRGKQQIYSIETEVCDKSDVKVSIESTCDFIQLLGDVGKQDPICMHARGTAGNSMDLSMDAASVAELRASLVQNRDGSPNDGIAKTIDALINELDKDRNGYVFSSVVELVTGPPGVGKSYTMRNMMDVMQTKGKAVAVHSPFGKLSVDYAVESGGKGPFPFFTTHKLYKVGKLNLMVVEEYTNMDERIIAYMAYKTGAQMVVLIGDEKQTGLMPTEGERPFKADGILKLDGVREHILPKNFRSSAYDVAILNSECGYCLYAENDDVTVPAVLDTVNLDPEAVSVMCFSKSTAHSVQQEFGCENTVRRNQGQTHDNGTHILLKDGDENMVSNDALFAVSISRRKVATPLIIYADTSAVRARMENRLRLHDAAFQENVLAIARPNYREYYENLRAKRFGPDLCDDGSGWHDILIDNDLVQIHAEEPKDGLDWAESVLKTIWHECDDKLNSTSITVNPIPEVKLVDTTWDKLVKLKAKKPIEWCTEEAMGARASGKKFTFPMPALSDELRLDYVKFILDNNVKSGKVPINLTLKWLKEKKIEYLIFDTRSGITEGTWRLGGESGIRLGETELRTFSWIVEYNGYHVWPMTDDLLAHLVKHRTTKCVREDFSTIKINYCRYWTVRETEIMNFCTFINYDKDANIFRALTTKVKDGLETLSQPTVKMAEDSAGGVGLYGPDEVYKTIHKPDMRNDLAICMADENDYSMGGGTFIERGDRYPMIDRWEREMPGCVDGYLTAETIDPTVGTNLRTNAIGAAMGASKLLQRMKIQRDPLYVRLDRKGRMLPDVDNVLSFGGGFGNTQTTANVETLGSAERYFVKPKGSRISVEGRRHATRMAEKHYYRHFEMTPEITLDVQDGIQRQFEVDAKKRSYDVRALGLSLKGVADRVVTFSNKSQFKWGKTNDPTAKESKVGQGISATSPAINLRFGALMRQADHAYAVAGKHYNIFDCYMSSDQLMDRVTTEIRRLPSCVGVVTSDADEFDSAQNWHSARAECRLNGLLIGHVEDFEAYVDEVRTDYPVHAPGLFSGTVAQAKPSGAPDTLGGNTRTSDMYTEELIEGKGPVVMVKKGDDKSRLQYGQRINRDKAKKLALYSPLTLKITEGDVQFCGMVMTKDGMYENLMGIVKKALAHGDKSYKTWAEYQISLRDRMKSILKRGLMETIIATAAATNMSINQVWVAYSVFQSLCHISESQWLEVVVDVQRNVPAMRDANFTPRPWG